MPSATNGTRTVKSASPDLGFAPGSMNQITASNPLTGTQSEAMKQVLVVLEKKVRNMEKKKSKLDDYQARNSKGERLNQDQLEALSKYQEIIHNLEFARELHKSFLALGQEIQKCVKKVARREQLQREEVEQKRLKRVLELQFLLDRLGDESVRQELLQGAGGPSLLTESDLTSLDEFYKLVGPERDQNIRLTDQYQEASQHLWELLEGKDKPVAGTTYKALNEMLERVLQSGYFDRVQSHQNGVCVEEEEQTAAVEVSEAEEHPPDTGKTLLSFHIAQSSYCHSETVAIQTDFVNRQFVLESTCSTGEKEQSEEWSVETEVVNSMQPVQTTPTPVVPEPHPLTTVTPTPPSDPVVRQQVVQDLMAQIQGPYNFMQVFNFNAPVPPANDTDSMKQASQYQNSYSQGFNNQTQHPVEHTDMPPEQLQSVVGAFHSQDQSLPNSTGPQPMSQQSGGQGNGFSRQTQSFYNSRGISRGGPRNSRGMINGYRGTSSGFRGGYDSYRPGFSNSANSGYGQTQFSTPRDYSNNYQRDGYQQNYKRGAGQGARGVSRGNAQAMRS
uniref:Cell cycle associated protein 1b n=1 Tax=Cyprinus carpio TaxID=7962 RepID=A0A8C1UMB3_CYPCA